MKDIELSYNERRFLEMIFRMKSISRRELAEQLDLTAASTTRIATRLLELDLIEERVDRSGGMGQPRRPVAIRPERVFSAGINFALNTIDVAVIDLAGRIVAVERHGLERSSPEVAAQRADEILAAILQREGIARERLVGAGISVPANFVGDGNSVVPNALFTEYEDLDLNRVFGEAIDLDITVENDGACAALGEYYFAEGYRHEVLFLYHLGHGFNAGAVINGALYRGVRGNSCVTGVLFPYGEPRPTGTDLVNLLGEHGVDLADVADLAAIPDTGAAVLADWLDRAARQLEQACRIATGFFDPSVIVIGGRLPLPIVKRLTDQIRWQALDGPSRGLGVAPVIPSRLGPDGGAIGAACAPFLDRFFPGAMRNRYNNYLNGRRSVQG